MDYCTIIAFCTAFLLDIFIGDPRWLPHPIRWMGKSIEVLEPYFRRWPLPLPLAGGLMTIFLVTSTYLLVFGLLQIAKILHPLLELIVTTVLLFYCISIKSLYDSAFAVDENLQNDDLKQARKHVGWIVGRDTDRLDETGVRLATIETVAENFVDGVAAPLLFAAIGGAPLAMAYKMINTLDSMIGYKNERYVQFGKIAARFDDLANYLPARLAVPVIALGARLLGLKGRRAMETAVAEGSNHNSPNAGFPEAAFAGALNIRLNGPGIYGGKLVEKPFIGVQFGKPGVQDIRRACDLMVLSSLLWVLITVIVISVWQLLV